MAEQIVAVWDIDGTYVDSHHKENWNLAAGELVQGLPADQAALVGHSHITDEEYETRVTGIPRMDGALAIVDMLQLPGDPEVVAAQLSGIKQAEVKGMIARGAGKEGGFDAYDDARRLHGVMTGKMGWLAVAASSSQNANDMLAQLSLPNEVPVLKAFNGNVNGSKVLVGKPAGYLIEAAMASVGGRPRNTVVIGDAAVDIMAGKDAHVAYTIGVARNNDEEKLRKAGADLVVTNLDDVNLEEVQRQVNWRRSFMGRMIYPIQRRLNQLGRA